MIGARIDNVLLTALLLTLHYILNQLHIIRISYEENK